MEIAPNMILVAPFVYKQGVTKSMVMIENAPAATFDDDFSGSECSGSGSSGSSGSSSVVVAVEKLDELNDPCRRKAVAIGDST